MVRAFGFRAARVDLTYHGGDEKRQRAMNLLSDAGLALLLCITGCVMCMRMHAYICVSKDLSGVADVLGAPCFHRYAYICYMH